MAVFCGDNVGDITTTFITASSFAHKGRFTDTVAVLAVNEEGVDGEFGTVRREGAFKGGSTRVGFADWSDAIEVNGDSVGGFTAAFVVGGCISHEGWFAGAFAVFAKDPVDVDGEVSAVFYFGAFWSNACEFLLLVDDDSVWSVAAAFVIYCCGTREGFFTFTGSIETHDESVVH